MIVELEDNAPQLLLAAEIAEVAIEVSSQVDTELSGVSISTELASSIGVSLCEQE